MKNNFNAVITDIKENECGIVSKAFLTGENININFDYHPGYLFLNKGDTLKFTIFLHKYIPLENQTCLLTGIVNEVSSNKIMISVGGLIFYYEGEINDVYENDKIYISIKKI